MRCQGSLYLTGGLCPDKDRDFRETGFRGDRMTGSTHRGWGLRARFLGEDIPQNLLRIEPAGQVSPALDGFCERGRVPLLGCSCHPQQFPGTLCAFSLPPQSVPAPVSPRVLEHSFLGERLVPCEEIASGNLFCQLFTRPLPLTVVSLPSLPQCRHPKTPLPPPRTPHPRWHAHPHSQYSFQSLPTLPVTAPSGRRAPGKRGDSGGQVPALTFSK